MAKVRVRWEAVKVVLGAIAVQGDVLEVDDALATRLVDDGLVDWLSRSGQEDRNRQVKLEDKDK